MIYIVRGEKADAPVSSPHCDLSAAIRLAAALEARGATVRIYAVGEDGAETMLPTYEEALAAADVAWRSGPEWPEDRAAKLAAIEAHVGTFRSRDDTDAAFCVALEWATAEIREADERVRFANDDRMRAIRELGETRRSAHGAEREIREASDALVALGIPEDGRPLAERIRALAPVAPPEIAARHAAIGEDATTMDLGAGWQAHEDRGVLLALRRAPVPAPQTLVDRAPLVPPVWSGTREATIAKLPADVATSIGHLPDGDAAAWTADILDGADPEDIPRLVAKALQKAARDGVQFTDAEMMRGPHKYTLPAAREPLRVAVSDVAASIEGQDVRDATAPEPPPLITGSEPIWPLVIADAEVLDCAALVADMKARDAFGRAKYGTPLTADNGRSHLADAYQEALDEVVYLRAAVEQGRDVGPLYHEALAHAVKLRTALDVDALRDRMATLGDQIDGYEHAGTQPPPALVAEYHEARARLTATEKAARGTPRIVVTPVEPIERGESLAFVDGPGHHGVAPMPTARYPKSPRGEGMRDLRRLTGATLGDVARALNLSTPEVSGLEHGRYTTDDAGWSEIQTVCFLLGSNVKVEHILDPASSPSFQRAMADDGDDRDDFGDAWTDEANAGPQTDEDRADVARVIRQSCVDEEEAWIRVLEERATRQRPPPEPSDIWPIDALVYCKVCHKTHAARAGEKMCGGAGSWIAE